jgi:predicted small secreted protein
MNRLSMLFLLAAALLLAGCNTIQGAGKDIQKAGQAVERAAKGAKKS